MSKLFTLLGTLARIWRAHFVAALSVGLVVGTVIGLAEGIWVLESEGLFGRYNELVAWGIAFDAPAMVGVEFGLAIISGVFFSMMEVVPPMPKLVSLQLGETVFVIVLGYAVWSQATANPSIFTVNPLGAFVPPAALGLFLGEVALIVTMLIVERAPLVQRLHARHCVALEAIIIAGAIAFGFSH